MMTLSEFEEFVPPTIFMRGIDYYNDNAVKNLKETSTGEWKATVEGTKEYSVRISLDGNKISSWFCNCPYDGDICKHIVAVMYAIRKERRKVNLFLSAKESVIVEEMSEKQHQETPDIEKLLSYVDKKKLIAFICQHALTHPDLQEALLQNFAPKKSTGQITIDYNKKIDACFNSSYRNRSSRYGSFEQIDLDEISSKLSIYLDKARFFFEKKSFDDAASIALHIIHSIVNHYDEDNYYNYYDDFFVLEYDCETAGELLLDIAKHPETPQSLKEVILKEIRTITKKKKFCDYPFYNIDELLLNINIYVQTKEGALQLINDLLEEQKDSDNIYGLVNKKINFLYQLNRQEEAETTIKQYLYLSEIREKQVLILIEDKKYSEALSMLDEGIHLAEEKGHHGTVYKWKKQRLGIYIQTNNVPYIIATAKDLFLYKGGNMELYHTLKKYVPIDNWKTFLKKLLEQPASEMHFNISSSVKADIYVEEEDYENLKTFLVKTSNQSLDYMLIYAHHLTQSYSDEMLAIYNNKIQKYAEQNVGRNYYEYIVQVLKKMLEFPKGKEMTNLLVADFRIRYKRRPAMMELLREF
nr:SWIM zinc finger family protein [uncultured Bacteroides sp.]